MSAAPELLSADWLLRELYRLHNPEAVVSGVHLITRPASQQMHICVQKEKLLLAFENLFYNALRFTPTNGIIALEAEADGALVRLSVSETGGSGLGLYITKMIISELGGEIEVRSEAGAGSVFTISLPEAR